jgi:hypothetical protein
MGDLWQMEEHTSNLMALTPIISCTKLPSTKTDNKLSLNVVAHAHPSNGNSSN